MATFILKPETFFPQMQIHNDSEMLELLGFQDNRKLRVLFKRSGIETKYALYDFHRQKINERLTDLCWGAINTLFANNNISPGDIDGIIACYNTEDDIQIPGLSSRLFEKIDFRPDIHNYPLYGLGCGAFISAINLARHLLKEENTNNILIVCCEASTLYYPVHNDPDDNSQMTALTLFGDGAAATIATRESSLGTEKAEVLDIKVATHFSDSMTRVNNITHLDELMLENISPYIDKIVTSLLDKNNLGLDQIKHWVMHSGGKKILQGVQKLFNLSDTQMLPSAKCYREYGNISCASVPTALNKLFALGKDGYIKESGDLGVILGFGSGFFLGAGLVKYL